jgi:HD superfamily phosphohydrolase
MSSRLRTVRDPLWNTIRLDETAIRIIDTPAFQRLRYIRQLGFAHLVYPGATHTRFDHALGVHHLVTTALRLLRERGGVPDEVWLDHEVLPYAALLHDIGHYAYSHALEELSDDRVPADHEEASGYFFDGPELRAALAPLGPDAPDRIRALIRGQSDAPLRGLVSGSLDLDKQDYLRRDARFCGVPYGEVDVDRLLQGMVLLQDPEHGLWELGVHEKAVAALESLLFAKYQMFRNVYWHHGVRAATALYKRIIEEAVRIDLLRPDELLGPTDEELLYEVSRRASLHGDDAVARRLARRWIPALRNRRLPKRALELPASELGELDPAPWLHNDLQARRRIEDAMAVELDLEPGEVFIDFPMKSAMFQLDVLVQRRDGAVERVGSGGRPGLLDLGRVTDELYRSARLLRVYTFERRALSAEDVLARLAQG